jgi:hypothetical protein
MVGLYCSPETRFDFLRDFLGWRATRTGTRLIFRLAMSLRAPGCEARDSRSKSALKIRIERPEH